MPKFIGVQAQQAMIDVGGRQWFILIDTSRNGQSFGTVAGMYLLKQYFGFDMQQTEVDGDLLHTDKKTGIRFTQFSPGWAYARLHGKKYEAELGFGPYDWNKFQPVLDSWKEGTMTYFR